MTPIVQVLDELALPRASGVIGRGGIVVYPTDTLYGIGADALNRQAVRRVNLAKKRSERKPILVLISGLAMLDSLAAAVSPSARIMMDTFWPGPMTLVFSALPGVHEDLTGGTGTIGVRLPAHPWCIRLLEACGCALTSSSANITGHPVQASITGIQEQLGGSIDLYLDAGELPPSGPSTVLDVSREPATLIREGAISRDQIQALIPLS